MRCDFPVVAHVFMRRWQPELSVAIFGKAGAQLRWVEASFVRRVDAHPFNDGPFPPEINIVGRKSNLNVENCSIFGDFGSECPICLPRMHASIGFQREFS
jgi:hypothetical protein